MTDVEIIVIGDVYWDTVVVPLPGGKSDNNPLQPAYARIERRGGAWLLQSMIAAATGHTINGYGEVNPKLDPNEQFIRKECLKQEECRRALTILKLFSKDDKETNKVYRVDPKQQFVWVVPDNPQQHFSNCEATRKQVYQSLNDKLIARLTDSSKPRIVVVNETRDHDFCDIVLDNGFLTELLPANSWLIYHMANPSSQDGKQENKLWNLIKDRTTPNGPLSRTMVIVSTTSLRSAGGFYIDQQAAQETIAEDLMRWLKLSKDFPLNDLGKLPAHLIVRCDYDSVFHFCSLNEQDRRNLHIYSRPFEGNPQSNEGLYGKMPGYGRILVASIVQCLAELIPPTPDQLDPKVIRNGICNGLWRTAAHFRNGFASKQFGENYSKPNTPPPSASKTTPFENLFRCKLKLLFQDYPRDDYNIGNIGKHINDEAPKIPLLAKISIPWAELESKSFSRVESLQKCLGQPQSFEKFLFDVVKYGLNETLKDDKYKEKDLSDNKYLISLPALKLKNLISIDRDEIDGITDLYVLIRKYMQEDSWLKPISFAVFGPPGTGKSFSVNQILEAASEASPKSGKVEILVYNLSEFSKAENLARAFHKGQDLNLSGKVPLIFFDEFDAALPGQPYAWLKYFLAPMQDGRFKGAEDETYTIGRAILVFAGGTAKNFTDFETNVSKAREAKGPDFISRLKAHLNIMSINEIKKPNEQGDTSTRPDQRTTHTIIQAINRLTDTVASRLGETKKNDEQQDFVRPSARLKLRRAILLRTTLELEMRDCIAGNKTARIDQQVIKAFLNIPGYKHGSRSLISIVQMATLEHGSFQVASLASKEQLEMHVDGKEFLELAGVKGVAAPGMALMRTL